MCLQTGWQLSPLTNEAVKHLLVKSDCLIRIVKAKLDKNDRTPSLRGNAWTVCCSAYSQESLRVQVYDEKVIWAFGE